MEADVDAVPGVSERLKTAKAAALLADIDGRLDAGLELEVDDDGFVGAADVAQVCREG